MLHSPITTRLYFHEYAIDIAQACHQLDIKTVAVTAGYIMPEPRAEFFRHMDAANIDLKAFTDSFYKSLCGAELDKILETIKYVKHETRHLDGADQSADSRARMILTKKSTA